MTRRRVLLLGSVAALAAMAFGAWVTWPRPSAITDENSVKIQTGMTLAEVEAILGGPPRNEVGHAADRVEYGQPRVVLDERRWIGPERDILGGILGRPSRPQASACAGRRNAAPARSPLATPVAPAGAGYTSPTPTGARRIRRTCQNGRKKGGELVAAGECVAKPCALRQIGATNRGQQPGCFLGATGRPF